MEPRCASHSASSCLWLCSWVAVEERARRTMGEMVQGRQPEERRQGARAKAEPADHKLARQPRLGPQLAVPHREALRARDAPVRRPRLAAPVWNRARFRAWAPRPLIAAGVTIGGRSAARPRFAPLGLGLSRSRPLSARTRCRCRRRARQRQRQRQRQANAPIRCWRAGMTTERSADAAAARAAPSTLFANPSILRNGPARNRTPPVRILYRKPARRATCRRS